MNLPRVSFAILPLYVSVCGSLSQFLFLKPTVYACSWGPLPARTGDLTPYKYQ